MYIATAAELPACDAAAEKTLIYVAAESLFKACQSGQWTDVSIQGKQGEQGRSVGFDRVYTCKYEAADQAYVLKYQISFWTSGEMMVFADAHNSPGSYVVGTSRYYQSYAGFGSAFYKPDAAAAKNASVTVDVARFNTSPIKFEFTFNESVPEARAVIDGNTASPLILTCAKDG
jgi:hypothetical protein